MDLPILKKDNTYLSIERILIYTSYCTLIWNYNIILESIRNINIKNKINEFVIFCTLISYLSCLIFTIVGVWVFSKLLQNTVRGQGGLFYILILASISNSTIYLLIDYWFFSSVEYPLRVERAVEIICPFFLSTLICKIL
jgi:hypothetical protein